MVGTSDTAMVQYSCDVGRSGPVRLMGDITPAHTRECYHNGICVLYEIPLTIGAGRLPTFQGERLAVSPGGCPQ